MWGIRISVKIRSYSPGSALCIRSTAFSPSAATSTTNVIRYNGRLYNITRIDIFEGYKQDLTLYCKRK